MRAVEGGRITLKGSGFPVDTIPEVTVGGQRALVAFASSTRIAVAIPSDVEPGPAGLPAVADGDLVGAIIAAVERLDDSYVAVQGPPGTGKTHVGAHVVARLVRQGWRVGVVAQSHATVENMLRAIVEKAGAPAGIVAKKRAGDGPSPTAVCAARCLPR